MTDLFETLRALLTELEVPVTKQAAIEALMRQARGAGMKELMAQGPLGGRAAPTVAELGDETLAMETGEAPQAPLRARVQVRYRHEGALAKLEPAPGGRVRALFDAPVRAVAPGQAAVFYAGDVVLGGGPIAAPIP